MGGGENTRTFSRYLCIQEVAVNGVCGDTNPHIADSLDKPQAVDSRIENIAKKADALAFSK